MKGFILAVNIKKTHKFVTCKNRFYTLVDYKSIYIIVPESSNRLKYILDFIFLEQLSCHYKLILAAEWMNFPLNGPCFSYGLTLEGIPQLEMVDAILTEECLLEKNIEIVQNQESMPYFWKANTDSFFYFDIFAASFFLLSRYEEYTSISSDFHGRFPAEDSLAFKNGFLHRSLIHEWLSAFTEKLNLVFPQLQLANQSSYALVPSFDIDIAWAYQHKGFLRNTATFIKNILLCRFELVKEQILVLSGRQRDPFDTYELIHELKKNHKEILVFWLLGSFGKFDKNHPIASTKFQKLIQSLVEHFKVGLHPSYGSHLSVDKLKKEKIVLESLIRIPVSMSRQHFLKFRLPDTYQSLLEIGVEEEYSMGYPDQPGFRASFAGSFYWFDLKKNEQTSLKIRPFALMDVTLKNYLKLSSQDAIRLATEMKEAAKSKGYPFIVIWHNSSFGSLHGWEGWKEVFDKVMEK